MNSFQDCRTKQKLTYEKIGNVFHALYDFLLLLFKASMEFTHWKVDGSCTLGKSPLTINFTVINMNPNFPNPIFAVNSLVQFQEDSPSFITMNQQIAILLMAKMQENQM